jgi:hypothetical protein
LENVGVYGRIILKIGLKKCYGEKWTGLFWLRTRQVAGTSGFNNELSGF